MGTLISVLNLLQINQSVFVMFGIFILTYWVLKFMALGKLSSTLIERDHRLEGRVDSAEKFFAEARELKTSVQAEMAKAQSEASQSYNALKTKAQEKHRAVLQSAKEASQKIVGDSRAQVNSQIQGEIKKIESEIPALAKLMVDQILKPGSSQGRSTSLNQGL
jgi:F0F1-type ATP synthase membrane subunit b/b'